MIDNRMNANNLPTSSAASSSSPGKDMNIPIVEAEYIGKSTCYKPSRPSFELFEMPRSRPPPLTTTEIQELRDMGFPPGLAQAMNENTAKFPLRVWIIDNSGSMKRDDGSRIVCTRQGYKVLTCTRWMEMKETVFYHAEMAAKTRAATLFRLLNKPFSSRLPREFGVALTQTNIPKELELAQNTVRKIDPKGCSPLSKRVWEIRRNIELLKEELLEKGEKVVVVLATDGLPTDRDGACSVETRDEFVEALKSLEGLPVWIVIRLCTQADDVVNFYNSLDKQLELSLEVLDDFFEEAKELYKHNKWINYALCLHRAREMGFHHHIFDLMDERKLTLDEVKEYFIFLFGEASTASLPDPVTDFNGFLHGAQILLNEERSPYNPIKKKDTPWVDLKKLAKAYNRQRRCIIA